MYKINHICEVFCECCTYVSNITYAKYYADSYLPPLTPSKKWKMAACHVWWISPQVARWSVERASICMEMRRGKWYGHEGFCEIVCCVCVIVCLRLRLCLCLCHVLSFTYLFTDHLLVLFTYHLPVGLSVSVAARVRAHFEFFFEWFSKGSLQKYMNEPCFSFGCVVRLPLFFFGGPISPGWRLSSGPPVFPGFAPTVAPDANLLSLSLLY